MNKRKSNNQSYFSIDLKISGKVMSVPVLQNDSHQTLIKRFCANHLIKQQYQQTVKQKIIQSLHQIIKTNNLQPVLKEKVQKFIQEKGKQNIPQKKFQRSSPPKFEKDTPYKVLQMQKSSRKNSTNRNIASQCLKISPPKHKIVTKGIKKNIINRPNQRRIMMDKDLIKAYETIYKKSRQPNMKNMAKKFLQTYGYFSNNKLQVPQLSYISAKTPDISMNPIPTSQFSPSKIEQTFEINKNYQPQNFNQRKYQYLQQKNLNQRKYQTFEPQLFRQRPQQKSRKYLESHHQSLIYNNIYTNQAVDLSKYDIPRASRSYQRINHTIFNKLYDDTIYYDQIQRRDNSIGKTRKYKYLD